MEGPDERLTADESAADPGTISRGVGDACRNCGRPLDGRYCGACGQADRDFDVPLVRFAKEFLSESFDLDARLRQTIGPLFLRPGYVAAEYVAGHRARFVPPVRMYILASFVLFLVLSLTANSDVVVRTNGPQPSVAEVEEEADIDGPPGGATLVEELEGTPLAELEGTPLLGALGDSLRARLARGASEAAADPEAFTNLFLNRMAQGMFLLLPAFALLLKLLWRDHLYVHHLIFSVNFHTVVFFVIAASEIVGAIPGRIPEYLSAGMMLAVPTHLVFGLRRFYQSGWLGTVAKGAFLGGAYLTVLVVTLMGLLLLSVLYL